MSRVALGGPTRILAAQDATLSSLRGVFDQIDFDLQDALRREEAVSLGVDSVSDQVNAARARLRELGIDVPTSTPNAERSPTRPTVITPPSRYEVPLISAAADFDELVRLSDMHLDRLGIDLTRDPLQQLLPSSEIAKSLQAFDREYGELTWSEGDWAAVIVAAVLATIVDIVLVRTPKDMKFHGGKESSGSPLTAWLKDRDRAVEIHDRFFRKFEGTAKVPYDAPTTAATQGKVRGMRPATHRLMSLGHDPVLGFLVGTADIMHGTGTYIDKAGKLVQVTTGREPVQLINGLITQIHHLLSDVYTPAGIPPPIFSLLQLGTGESPFSVRSPDAKSNWTDVAHYMYENGYDLRHFFTMGIVPGVVEMVIQGYWFLDNYVSGKDAQQRKRERLKLRSMLLFGHTLAASGTLLKTGVLYGMNPLALNYAQILAVAPAAVAWTRESIERDHRIAVSLELVWQDLLEETKAAQRSRGFLG